MTPLDALRAALPGLEVRPPTLADAAAATALLAACERAAHGEAEIEQDEVVESWSRAGLELARDAVLVLDAGRLVAVGEVYRGRAAAGVAPEARGRGIGRALVAWWRARAHEAGDRTSGQTLSDLDLGARALLEGLGARPTHTAWVLRLDLPAALDAPLPPDVRLRDARADEAPAVFALIDAAFSEWPGREAGRYDDWRASAFGRAGWEGWMAPVAVDATERLVGAAILRRFPGEGWVQELAVAADRRREGIARGLLAGAAARFAGVEPALGLSTDSRTGALDLYLRLGMHVRRSYTRWTFG